MTIFALTDELIFPDPGLANEDGLLAVGGDLSLERLLLAYQHGIFPWYDNHSPILWWALNPRMVLFPNKFKVSKSLRQLINKEIFEIRIDHNFKEVLDQCSLVPRKDQHGTWITDEMKNAYVNLFDYGFAHSVEAYLNQELVGGLYGVAIGKIFYGESMFHLVNNASKVAFYYLIQKLNSLNYNLIDAQMETPLIKSLGGELIPLEAYRTILKSSIDNTNFQCKW
ncbi:MAG: leucyl/phenylalanyl-tRNA--protein transferase [Bacteroidetes bacterium HGW-Bacteroidetes-17]|jgi:leucyl/phenylalanyl-tRNA--protein transferase|nr:MAG: leucyl/phenylalanyl-tRNA--protein transferase [Bacteroidetes bacterium HGW-Bacteroidetes-17]